MPSSTSYAGLTVYNAVTDAGVKFYDWRNAVSGDTSTSNMEKIDAFLKSQNDAVTDLITNTQIDTLFT